MVRPNQILALASAFLCVSSGSAEVKHKISPEARLLDAYGIKIPVSYVEENGKSFSFSPDSFPFDFEVEEGELKQGGGTVLTVQNSRNGKKSSIVIQRNDDSTLRAHYNPLQYAKEGDFQVGDELDVLYYGALYDENICNRVSFDVVQSDATSTGWNIDPEAVRVGKSGLVGGWWKDMTLQFELDHPASMVWTDAVDLEMEISMEGPYDTWTPLETSVNPDFPSLRTITYPSGVEKSGMVQITFPTTSLEKLQGLSTYRDGGGLHIDFCAAPTEAPSAAPSMTPSASPSSMPSPVPTPRPTLECEEDSDCEGELRCNAMYSQCIKPVCDMKDTRTNYGRLRNGYQRQQRIRGLSKEECRAQVGMERSDGSTVVYAASGIRVCHTYLDFFKGKNMRIHRDRSISGAWGLCDEVYRTTDCESINGEYDLDSIEAIFGVSGFP